MDLETERLPAGAPSRHALTSDRNRRRRLSAAARIYAQLRGELLSLQRRPGDPIVEKEIAAAYGVSRTPVREAILRLADEGLVDIFPQSGTFVARIPIAALPEAIVIRKALEETTARLAAKRASAAHFRELDAALECQRQASERDDRKAFHRADEAFHAAIAEAAGHPGIWMLVQQVKAQVDRFRMLTLPQKGRMARVIKEHAAIVAAMRRRDAASAAARMGAHLERLLKDLDGLQHLEPDLFIGSPRSLPASPDGVPLRSVR